MVSVVPTIDNVRSSMVSTKSDQSYFSMSSYRSSSGNSSLGRETTNVNLKLLNSLKESFQVTALTPGSLSGTSKSHRKTRNFMGTL